MISKILLILAALVAAAVGQIYRGPHPPTKPYIEPEEEKYPPQPYTFAYDSKNDLGATQFRKEAGDSNGRVTGSYGYRDENGVERIVEYVADENGYRANVKTNEPGTENKSPANIELYANPLPIEYEPESQRYTPRAPIPYVAPQPHPHSANSEPEEIYAVPRASYPPQPQQSAPPRRRHRYHNPGSPMPYSRPEY